jgi:hypothetical protein
MAGRLALVVAAIVASLVMLEGACRLARGRNYLVHWPNLVLDLREGSARYYQTVMSPDHQLGLELRRNLVHETATHDALGLRATPADTAIAKRPLILATGGSFVYGAEVADRETWPSALQRRLHMRVANGGVGSYGLDQIVMRTERLAGLLRPDAIVLSFNEDNVRRNELSRFGGLPKPYFTQSGDELVLHNTPVPPPLSARQSLTAWEHAFGWSILLDTVLRRLGWPEDWPYDSVRVLPRGAGERMACPLMKRLAALAVPTLVIGQHDPWEDDAAMNQQRRTVTAVLQCAQAAGLATLDTFDAVARDGRPDSALFKSEGHLNGEGNALIAAAVADRLQQLGWLSRHR